MINQSLLNIGLYIQPLETCVAFSCPLTLCPSISCQATSCLASLSKFVLYFHVRQFHVWTLSPSISRPSNSCLDILMVRHFHVLIFSAPVQASKLSRQSHKERNLGEGLCHLPRFFFDFELHFSLALF